MESQETSNSKLKQLQYQATARSTKPQIKQIIIGAPIAKSGNSQLQVQGIPLSRISKEAITKSTK